MLPHLLFEKSVKEALLEDLGRDGDITSEAIVNQIIKIEAALVARHCGDLCVTATDFTAFNVIDP